MFVLGFVARGASKLMVVVVDPFPADLFDGGCCEVDRWTVVTTCCETRSVVARV